MGAGASAEAPPFDDIAASTQVAYARRTKRMLSSMSEPVSDG